MGPTPLWLANVTFPSTERTETNYRQYWIINTYSHVALVLYCMLTSPAKVTLSLLLATVKPPYTLVFVGHSRIFI